MEEEFEYNPGYAEERNYGRIYPGFDCRRRRRPGALYLRRGRYIPEALTPDKANGRALPAIAVAARAEPRARRLARTCRALRACVELPSYPSFFIESVPTMLIQATQLRPGMIVEH